MALVAGCASSGGAVAGGATPYRGPVMPGREGVSAWTVRDVDGRSTRIYIRNNGDAALRVTSLELYACENVNQPCLPMDPRIVLGPGQTTVALTVGPSDREFGYSFQFRFATDAVRAPTRGAALATWTETERNGSGLLIFFRNNTSAPIRIASIELYDCENVSQECATSALDLVLPPGKSALAMTVQPRLPNFEFTFKYRYRLRPGS
jgi:hypothetical protein